MSATRTVSGVAPVSTDSVSPRCAPSESAACSSMTTSPGRSAPTSTVRPRVEQTVPKPAMRAGSGAKSVTRGSVWRDVTSCTAIVRTIVGSTPSTRSVPRSAPSTSPTTDSGKARSAVLDATEPSASGFTPFAVIHSSLLPRLRTTVERTLRPIVSPVPSAAAMIAVASIRPTTMSALRPGRRAAPRMPSRRKTRLRSASVATTATAVATTTTSANASGSIRRPNSFSMVAHLTAVRSSTNATS